MLGRFVRSYLLVLVPLLLASVLMTEYFRSQWQMEIRENMDKRLTQMASELELRYVNYQFSLAALVSEQTTAREGNYGRYTLVNRLRSVCHYDRNTDVLFVSTLDGEIISSLGTTSLPVFLTDTLRLTEESAARIQAALCGGQSAVTYLQRKAGAENKGYLLVLFPVSSSWSRAKWSSVGYLVSIENLSIAEYLSAPETVALRMTFADGSRMQVDLSESQRALSQIEEDASAYERVHAQVSNMQVQLELIYDWRVTNRVLVASQMTGLLLTFLGALLSAALGLHYSRTRLRNVEMLTAQAQGSVTDPQYTGEYIYVGRLMSSLRSEVSAMNLSMNEWQESVRQQTVSLMLSGSVQDRTTANRMLQTCRLEMDDDCYCVIKLLLDAQREGLEAAAVLPSEICCQAGDGEESWLILFGELPNNDVSQELRRAYAQDVIARLRAAGINVCRAGVSRAYKELYMANLALREATECLKADSAGGQTLVCFDDLAGAALGEIREKIHCFRRHLEAGEEREAREALHVVFDEISRDEGNEQIQIYRRYRLLDAALMVVCEREDEEKQAVYEALLNLDVRSGDTFLRELEALLFPPRREAPEEHADPWPVIVCYIEQHYMDPNLTANEVAGVAGVDKTHLSRVFREHTGETYIEYLSRVRLERAMALLTDTDMPVQEIVEAVGYYDHSSFRRKFKARYGISIQELRQRADKGSPAEGEG